jgi:hypothetical protein
MVASMSRRQFMVCVSLLPGFAGSIALTACSPVASQASSQSSTSTGQEVAAVDEDMAAINEALNESKSEYEEQIQPYRRDIALGETASLANIDADIMVTNPDTGEQIQSKMSDFVSWDGTLDVCIDSAVLYDSLDEAIQSQNLGELTSSRSAVGDDEKILVVQATVTNVDATPWTEGGYFNVEFLAPMYVAAGAYKDTINGVIVAFDGAPDEALVNEKLKSKFLLEQGQTKVLTTAWRLVVEGETSTLCIRPSMNLNEPGPVKFLLGLGDGDEGVA